MNIEKTVKKMLQWESTTLKLYEVERKSAPIGGFANIEAFELMEICFGQPICRNPNLIFILI